MLYANDSYKIQVICLYSLYFVGVIFCSKIININEGRI
ncbi:hypothetical protein HA1_02967 [Clostridium perfringens F262]|uniref:Uncharacterized protein n=1 Tax=Clostridium perfringens F262 TaxID=883064 RepID=A0AAV3FG96_CLOPF|nr:hypothetical protein HA1_02967 [Clostridium perfringens F262]